MPHFESQDPSAWGWARGPAANIVPFSYRGHAFPAGVAAGTQGLFTAALDRICAQPGFQLPTSTGLDAGCWGYNDRRKASGSGWSFHAYGLAIDLCAPWNPMGRKTPPPSQHRLPTNTNELVRPLGLLWGGTFGDWMHLEIHLSPDELGRSTTTRPTIRHGSRGAAVRDAQAALSAALRRAGLPAIAVDGDFGPATRTAVVWFQRLRGLEADGIIGPRTWAALGS